MKKIITKSVLALALPVALSLALSGCSQYALVNSAVYNDANLSDYHTFRIVTPDDGHLPPGMEMVTYYNIAAAIREQLVDRGFTEDPASPILVNIALTVKKEIATEPLVTPVAPVPPAAPVPPPHGPGVPPPGGGPGVPPPGPGVPPPGSAPMGPPPPVYNGLYPYYMYPYQYYMPANAQVITGIYREGVLTMDIVDIADKLPLYTSSVATILDQSDGQLRNLQGIAQAVKVLFSKFPVPLLPQYRKSM